MNCLKPPFSFPEKAKYGKFIQRGRSLDTKTALQQKPLQFMLAVNPVVDQLIIIECRFWSILNWNIMDLIWHILYSLETNCVMCWYTAAAKWQTWWNLATVKTVCWQHTRTHTHTHSYFHPNTLNPIKKITCCQIVIIQQAKIDLFLNLQRFCWYNCKLQVLFTIFKKNNTRILWGL